MDRNRTQASCGWFETLPAWFCSVRRFRSAQALPFYLRTALKPPTTARILRRRAETSDAVMFDFGMIHYGPDLCSPGKSTDNRFQKSTCQSREIKGDITQALRAVGQREEVSESLSENVAAGIPACRRGRHLAARKKPWMTKMAWYHYAPYRFNTASAGLEARLYVSQDGRRYHFQTGSKELIDRVYQELRQLAAVRMARESAGQTLQATALVHEA